MTRLRTLVLLALGAAGVLSSGCTIAVPAIAQSSWAVHYAATSQPQGPRVTFVNDSQMPLSVRYWVGRRDVSVPGAIADLRTDEHMTFTALPGDQFITQVGRGWWPTSNVDAVVWVRVDAGDPAAPTTSWFELEQPAPYVLQATGTGPADLAFHRPGSAGLVALPRDRWIGDHNGPFPVTLAR
jgi:hypothetical protein